VSRNLGYRVAGTNNNTLLTILFVEKLVIVAVRIGSWFRSHLILESRSQESEFLKVGSEPVELRMESLPRNYQLPKSKPHTAASEF
jgi:hypothetical protein